MLRSLTCALALTAAPAFAAGIEITVQGAHTEGVITIDLLEDVAPGHVQQITALAEEGFYDGVYFHRVIDGFMAQTGDGQYGRIDDNTLRRAGTGGSSRPDLEAEFSDIPFDRGVVGMARSQAPDSANSQFFIMFAEGYFLNGQYTVVGQVTGGLDVLDDIKRGDGSTLQVTGTPDHMVRVVVTESAVTRRRTATLLTTLLTDIRAPITAPDYRLGLSPARMSGQRNSKSLALIWLTLIPIMVMLSPPP